ncbi:MULTISPECIES: hypothetical protein [Streptomyces]|uniref:Integrase n=1 Tax=Streptomyces canarius TaxID=285453 RepID=A0ABQ3CY37_9ACTN|nr:hypothetical protein [Streptomyces canarius]GHA49324.1 hypothetical protein GCM10010345_62340 [Streptomyces canarius]
MASTRRRERKDGSAIYRVYRLQGGRGGDWQTGTFAEEDAADEFKELVNQWPPGRVRGKGFVEEVTSPGDTLLVTWAHRHVDRLTGIDERTRRHYMRDIDNHFSIIRHT